MSIVRPHPAVGGVLSLPTLAEVLFLHSAKCVRRQRLPLGVDYEVVYEQRTLPTSTP